MRKRWLIIPLFVIVALVACASIGNQAPMQSNAGNLQTRQEETFYAMATQAPTMVAMSAGVVDGQPQEPVDDQITQERVILKNASLTITVADPAAKINEITAMAEGMGGWVVTSNSYTSTNNAGEEVTYGSITVRVPSDRLAESMERIKTGAEEVNSENVNGQDVTQEYVDLSSRMVNLQATERQLQTIMESARKVEDVLSVQRELTTVRGEIETIQGRLQYFDEAAAFSSIAVELHPPQPGPVEAQSAGWNPGTTAASALGSLLNLVQFIVDTAITVVILVGPFVVIFGVPAWVLWRRRRHQRRASAA
jgi:hypothetical protein